MEKQWPSLECISSGKSREKDRKASQQTRLDNIKEEIHLKYMADVVKLIY
jgi:hypothetical protein